MKMHRVMGAAVLALSMMATPAAAQVGKSLGVLILTPFAGVRPGTAGLLCIALTPMSGLALALVQETRHVYPTFGAELAAIMLAAVLVLELVGPLAVQLALRLSGESHEEEAS